jgi:hypothetical protein
VKLQSINSKSEYYINANCSITEKTCTLDANQYGWHLISIALNDILINNEKISVTSKNSGGILTEFNSTSDYKIINRIEFNLLKISNETKDMQIIFNPELNSLNFYSGIDGYKDLLNSFVCLEAYTGRLPTDISYMSDEYGGSGLTNNLIEALMNEKTMHHLRLFRWK